MISNLLLPQKKQTASNNKVNSLFCIPHIKIFNEFRQKILSTQLYYSQIKQNIAYLKNKAKLASPLSAKNSTMKNIAVFLTPVALYHSWCQTQEIKSILQQQCTRMSVSIQPKTQQFLAKINNLKKDNESIISSIISSSNIQKLEETINEQRFLLQQQQTTTTIVSELHKSVLSKMNDLQENQIKKSLIQDLKSSKVKSKIKFGFDILPHILFACLIFRGVKNIRNVRRQAQTILGLYLWVITYPTVYGFYQVSSHYLIAPRLVRVPLIGKYYENRDYYHHQSNALPVEQL